MSSNIYKNSKDVFLDVVNPNDYVQLDRVSMVYQSLKESIKKPLKMVLLYGKPGTGKSMLLSKLFQDLSPSEEIFLYKTPITDENEFFKKLAKDALDTKYEGILNFTQLLNILETTNKTQTPLIILDEAQLYPGAMMEKIRLISDTRKVKFLITLHKTEKEDLIAKEHFQTRIWESIEHHNASKQELKAYIQKKLMKANCFDCANMFPTKSVDLIHKITQGNYRETNKLLYTLFEIYEWYSENNLSKINSNNVSHKIIEMSAIHTGLIDA